MPQLPSWAMEGGSPEGGAPRRKADPPPPSRAYGSAAGDLRPASSGVQSTPYRSPWETAPAGGSGAASHTPPRPAGASLPAASPYRSPWETAPGGGGGGALGRQPGTVPLPSFASAAPSPSRNGAAAPSPARSAPAPDFVPPWAAQLAMVQAMAPAPGAGDAPQSPPAPSSPPSPPPPSALTPPTSSSTPPPHGAGGAARRNLNYGGGGGGGGNGGAPLSAAAAAAGAAAYTGPLPDPPSGGLLDARPGEERPLMMAYEACVQACLSAVLEGSDEAGVIAAKKFLSDRCAPLARAFGLQGLLLGAGGRAAGVGASAAPPPHAAATARLARDAGVTISLASLPPPPPPPGAAVRVVTGRRASVELTSVDWRRPAGAKTAARALLPSSLLSAFGMGKGGASRKGSALEGCAVSVRVVGIPNAPAPRVVEPGGRAAAFPLPPSPDDDPYAPDERLCVLVEAVTRDGRAASARVPLPSAGRPATREAALADAAGTKVGTVTLHIGVEEVTERRAGVAAGAAQPQQQQQHAPAYRTGSGAAAAAAGAAGGGRRALIEAAPDEWRAASSAAVYDAALEAGLRSGGFARRRLALSADWAWLLRRLASVHGVSAQYASLRHALHILPGAATPSADCLSLVLTLIEPALRVAAVEGALGGAEARMLAAARQGADRLCAATFEQYKSLVESCPGGVAEAGVLPPGAACPAPALSLAVSLFGSLRDPLSAEARRLLSAHLRAGAAKCYWRHAAGALDATASAEAGRPPRAGAAPRAPAASATAPHVHHGSLASSSASSTFGGFAAGGSPSTSAEDASQPFQSAYAALARLCAAVGEECGTDRAIADAGVLPPGVPLPSIAAEEYTRELGLKLASFLKACPPPRPRGAALDCLDAVGDLHDSLTSHALSSPGITSIDPVTLFGATIRGWIGDSREALVARCKSWAAASRLTGPEGGAAVGELYAAMQAVLSEYERVVSRWPLFAVELEDALGAAERTMLSAVDGWVRPVLPPNFKYKALPPLPQSAWGAEAAGASDAAAPPLPPRTHAPHPPHGGGGGPTAAMKTSGGGGMGRLFGVKASPPAKRAQPPPHAAARPSAPPAPRGYASAGNVGSSALARTFSGRLGAASASSALGGLPSELAAALVALKAMEALRYECASRLKRWASGGPQEDGDAPPDGKPGSEPAFGTLFLTVGQELRGRYADLLQLAVRKAAEALGARGHSLRGLLKALPASGGAPALDACLVPFNAAVRDAVGGMERGAGRGRAFVGLARGLWDALAADALKFLLDDCKENSSWAKRSAAGAALEALQAVFVDLLGGSGGASAGDVREEDLRPPEHARKVADMQNLNLNISFSVY